MFSQITIKESFKTQQLIMEEATETGASKNYPLRGKKKKDILQVVLPVLWIFDVLNVLWVKWRFPSEDNKISRAVKGKSHGYYDDLDLIHYLPVISLGNVI